MKANMAYRRFRHFGHDKVTMDFAFFAIAFNIKKMCATMARRGKNGKNPVSSPACRSSPLTAIRRNIPMASINIAPRIATRV